MLLLQDWIAHLNFQLRRQLFSKIKLRKSLPSVDVTEQIKNERIFYQMLLSKAFKHSREFKTVWDVGCRNWSYAQSLAEKFPSAELIGIEVDGARRYLNLYQREDYAQSFVKKLNTDGYQAQVFFLDFRDLNIEKPGPHLFCFFFPFVSERPCLKWGLPLRFARFEELLKKAMLLNKSQAESYVLSVHQGEWEAEIARTIYQKLFMPFEEICLSNKIFKNLWPGQHDVILFITKICPNIP